MYDHTVENALCKGGEGGIGRERGREREGERGGDGFGLFNDTWFQ